MGSEQFRRFLILGLPKVLRAVAPQLGIEKYIGLLVLSVAPVLYKHINPYQDHQDLKLMTFTQLAQIIVVLCAMVKQSVKGDGANCIITAIIVSTLLPMLVMLLAYVYDPSGKFLGRILTPKKTQRIQTHAVEILEVLVSGHTFSDSEQVKHAKAEVVKAIKSKNEHFSQFEPADIQEIKLLYKTTGGIIETLGAGGQHASVLVILEDRLAEEALHASIRELLEALGVGDIDTDALLESESVKLRLLLWCMCPRFTPHLKWADVEIELEVRDSNQKLEEVALRPGHFLMELAEKGRQIAELAATDFEEKDSEMESVEAGAYNLTLSHTISSVEQGGAKNSAVRSKFNNPTKHSRSTPAAVHPSYEETDSESDESDPPSDTGTSSALVDDSALVVPFQNAGSRSTRTTSTGAPAGQLLQEGSSKQASKRDRQQLSETAQRGSLAAASDDQDL
jgi:hypothetical protein